VPDPVYLELLREAGIVTLGTATHLLEAIVLEESGVDFIIAQGAEAGGHRGTFIGHPEQGLVGILTLTPLLTKHIAVPIIAAGGIMDGRGIIAARVRRARHHRRPSAGRGGRTNGHRFSGLPGKRRASCL